MATAQAEPEAIRRELDRVLSNPGFSQNDRQSQFLRFLVERHLAGKDSDTEAVRLRARLEKYYGGDGRETH